MSAVASTARPRRVTAKAIEGQELVLLGVLAVLWLVLSFAVDTFFTASTLQDLMAAVAPVAIVGVGMTAIIVTGGIDVSVGSAVAVAMVVVGQLVRDSGLPFLPAVAVAVAVGAALGLVNGVLVAYGRVHPIIVTFATLNLYRWLAFQIFGGEEVNNIPGTLGALGGGAEGRTAGLPNAFLLAVVLAAVMWAYMRYSPTGRHLYAIGNDAHAARLQGVRVTRRLVSVYVITGVLVGLAAVVFIGGGGRIGQAVGTGFELQVIAAVVIGGTSILGGRGTVFGTVLGALLVGTVSAAVTLLGWPSELTALFIGVFILVAVGVDLLRQQGVRRCDHRHPTPDAQPRPGRRPSPGSLGRSLSRTGGAARRPAGPAGGLVLRPSAGGYLVAPYDLSYMASPWSMVPLAMLGLAELLVILSGRGGIDLSVGAIVSLSGMVFGFAYGEWGWPLLPALALALAAGVVLGAVNGLLVAYLRVPALIATLATYYAYSSLALISNDNAPISTRPLQDLNSITRSLDLGGLAVPRQVFTFLLPVAVVIWLLVNRAPYGRRLYAVGTNEVAARYASLDVARVRFTAYTLSGLLSAVVAVITAAQFASARPDAGTVGNGMALPAITIAVLGGVAIAGGVGRGRCSSPALLIVWLNAGTSSTSRAPRRQLPALRPRAVLARLGPVQRPGPAPPGRQNPGEHL